MSLATAWRLLSTSAGALAVLFYWADLAYGQSTASSSSARAASLPFVGCPSFGQGGVLEAPKGTSKVPVLREQDSDSLAYYKSANGLGVLAPRGWHCAGSSGSGGTDLFVGPMPITPDSSGWQGLKGAAIAIRNLSGENSGRDEIAQVIARVFPSYRWFARRVWDFDSPLPSGPYPKDTVTLRDKAIVEYQTPAQTEGLGNFNSWLGKNELPIKGIAILFIGSPQTVDNIPHLVLLSVRLPRDLARLMPAIVRYVKEDAMSRYAANPAHDADRR